MPRKPATFPASALLAALLGAPMSAALFNHLNLFWALAGLFTGIVCGITIAWAPTRMPGIRLPAAAATLTLAGMVPTSLVGYSGGESVDLFWSGVEPAAPFWIAGAALAYTIAALRMGRRPGHPLRPGRRDIAGAAAAALLSALLAGGQVTAAHGLNLITWTSEGGYGVPVDWDWDLTRATWYPAASAIIAAVAVRRLTTPLLAALPAGLGAGLSAALILYGQAQAVPVTPFPPETVLSAAALGGAIGAVAAFAALTRDGVRAGLIASIGLITIAELTWKRGDARHDPLIHLSMPSEPALGAGLIAPIVMCVAITVWTTRRADRETGILAGISGPLLLFATYLTINPGLDDQESLQAGPWVLTFVTVATALIVCPFAALISRGRARQEVS
ncbi:hypothetical protein [Nonomuraea dietziae]|uniref:hypothetical protein n=1 Tax=Nonomuraea dietziae TaxID=65515 RepID=UPI0033DC5464